MGICVWGGEYVQPESFKHQCSLMIQNKEDANDSVRRDIQDVQER